MRNHINFVKYGGLKFAESAPRQGHVGFLAPGGEPEGYGGCNAFALAAARYWRASSSAGPGVVEVSSTGLEIWHQWRPRLARPALWPRLLKLLTDLATGRPERLAEQLACVLEFYQPLMEEKYDNPSSD